nr:hypothetical protein GCM10017745_60340 [Saccharothrix mutabilis subsp. capreolus]
MLDGFSIYPDTKMDEARMVALLKEYGTDRVLVNSAADWGRSDPLKTYKTGLAMLAAGFTDADVDQVLWRNPVEFYGQSGRLLLDVEEVGAVHAGTGNSVLRVSGDRVLHQRAPGARPGGRARPARPARGGRAGPVGGGRAAARAVAARVRGPGSGGGPGGAAGVHGGADGPGLSVSTLNAFPYGDFHDTVVKHAVYRPNWVDPRRLAYTKDCATVLADLLPSSASYGSISTLPLGWREPWTEWDDAHAEAALTELTLFLRGLERPVRLAVEPEPGACWTPWPTRSSGWRTGWTPRTSGCAWTPATSRCPSPTPWRRSG